MHELQFFSNPGVYDLVFVEMYPFLYYIKKAPA